MLLHNIRSILDSVACLFIRPGLLEDMGRQNISDIVRPMRQQALDRAAAGIGIVDPISLDDGPPGFVEFGGVVGRVDASRLHRFHEQCAGILSIAEQHTAMPVDIGLQVFIEIEQIGKDQPERLCPKKDEPEFLKATDGMSTSQPCSRSLQRNSPHFMSSSLRSDVGK